jgi:hypothetical protein
MSAAYQQGETNGEDIQGKEYETGGGQADHEQIRRRQVRPASEGRREGCIAIPYPEVHDPEGKGGDQVDERRPEDCDIEKDGDIEKSGVKKRSGEIGSGKDLCEARGQ